MTDTIDQAYAARLKKRYASEKRFRLYGVTALVLTTLFLGYLLLDIVRKGWPAFFEHQATIQVTLDPSKLDVTDLSKSDFSALVKESWRAQFPDITSRPDKKQLNSQIGRASCRERVCSTV